MKSASKFSKFMFVFLIILFVGACAWLGHCILHNYFKEYPFLYIVFSVGLPLLLLSDIVILLSGIYKTRSYQSMREENFYLLGEEIDFFNPTFLENRIRQIRSKHKKDKAYLIAYSPSKTDTTNPMYRNSPAKALNRSIAHMMLRIFKEEQIVPYKHISFCFYHSIFLIYVFGDQSLLIKIHERLKEESYKIAEKEQIKIFVTPRFGVAEVSRKQSIYSAIDNVLYARAYAEQSFEDIVYYSPSLRKDASLEEIEKLEHALKNNEFEVYYQPKFSFENKAFVSSEALIRWNTPNGVVPPSRFIEKAELGGLIHEIDLYVFKSVCKKLRDDMDNNKRVLPVSMNFSLYEFYNPGFVQEIFDIINKTRIDPKLLEIEITETTSQANTFIAYSILKKIKEFGIKITMDDFGSGFSSISALNRMPFNEVKIDKSLIDGITSNNKSFETVKYVIMLCKANKMSVVAEGVETEKEVQILRQLKCDIAQGYYYSKPLKESEYDAFLIENTFESKEVKKV